MEPLNTEQNIPGEKGTALKKKLEQNEIRSNKKNKLFQVAGLVGLAVFLSLLVFFFFGRKTVSAWQEQYDLGMQYLSEGEYEKALLVWNVALEIDPERAETYIKLLDTYLQAEDYDGAYDVLNLAREQFGDEEWILEKDVILSESKEDETEVPTQEETMPPAEETGSRILNNGLIRNSGYYDFSALTQITFLNSLETAPADTWDYSQEQDNSVRAWLEGTHLYVAGDGGVIAGEIAEDMFSYGSILTALNLDGLDTSNVTDMSNMFFCCSGLRSLDVSGFDTSNVTDMTGMFFNCISLSNLDVRNFDTSNVMNMTFMFGGCDGLSSLDVSSFDTSKVTDMSGMFQYCSGLNCLDISSFVTGEVTKMVSMFDGCSSLSSLDVSGFNTINVTDMQYMFYECIKLSSLDVSGFDTSNVALMNKMFAKCSSLTTLDISNFDVGNAETTDMFVGTIWE